MNYNTFQYKINCHQFIRKSQYLFFSFNLSLFASQLTMEQDQSVEEQNQKEIYFYQYPFRGVFPYRHVYETFAKSRWYGKPLLQTLVRQFKAYDQAYYKQAIEEGRIKINSKNVTINYEIKNGDKLVHQSIRKEPPILDLEIQIISNDEQYLVVNKPPSFTVHTGGGFHYNTLVKILQIQKSFKNLFVLHRLDRLTSGLIIFGKNKQKPQIFHKQNESEEIKKMYFARVGGDFPWQQKTLYAQIECVSHKDGVYKVSKELTQGDYIKQLKQEQKIGNTQQKTDQNENNQMLNKKNQQSETCKNEQMKHLKGQSTNKKLIHQKQQNFKKKKPKNNKTDPDFKQSKTIFKKVFYDHNSDSTLLECYPISGRTHQIRVHLQFLGHSILNDISYGGRFVGNNIIRQIKHRQIILDNNITTKQQSKPCLQKLITDNSSLQQQHNANVGGVSSTTEDDKYQNNYGQKRVKIAVNNKESDLIMKQTLNKEMCQTQRSLEKSQKYETKLNEKQKQSGRQLEHVQNNEQSIMKKREQYKKQVKQQWDYQSRPWEICLHSYEYKLQGKVYRTEKPYWAQKSYQFSL